MAKERHHDCPVGPCTGKRAHDEAMCPRCWFSVDQDLRDEVWRTYRRFGAFGEPAMEARERALEQAEERRFGAAA